jgi:ATP-dependent helicase HrpA
LPRSDARYWLVEEYRVSLFAQELGTAEAVSPQRLEREFAAASAASTPAAPGAAPKPAVAAKPVAPPLSLLTAGTKKNAPLKSLGALGDLFRK